MIHPKDNQGPGLWNVLSSTKQSGGLNCYLEPLKLTKIPFFKVIEHRRTIAQARYEYGIGLPLTASSHCQNLGAIERLRMIRPETQEQANPWAKKFISVANEMRGIEVLRLRKPSAD